MSALVQVGAMPAFRRWRAARRPLFSYCARFAGYGTAFYAISFLPLWDGLVTRYLSATAALASVALRALHQPVQHLGARVFSTHFAVSVSPQCSAGDLLAFFAAALLAFPAPWRRKALGLALGAALLALLNVLRIVAVFLVGTSHPQLFESVHEELCPALLQLATLLMVLSSIWCLARDRQQAPVSLIPASLGRFAFIFALLLGLGLACTSLGGAAFRTLGAAAFYRSEGEREVTFEPNGARHTTAVIVNRTLMNLDGSGPVRNVDLDTFAYLWRPTLLVIALSLASPLPIRRRVQAAGLGVLALWVYAWAALCFALWNESSEVALVALTPFWKAAASELQSALVARLGLAVPVLVWLLWAFEPAETRTA